MKILGTCLAISMILAPAVSAAVASPDGAVMATAGGQIASIDAAAKSLVVKVNDPTAPPQELSFVVADDAKIIKNGTAVPLSELKAGDKVTVTYRAQNGQNLVVNIGVESKS
jgi:Cu/Ag efflux protein CusF